MVNLETRRFDPGAALASILLFALPLALVLPHVLRPSDDVVVAGRSVKGGPVEGAEFVLAIGAEDMRALDEEAARYVEYGKVEVDGSIMRPAVLVADGHSLRALVRLKGDKLDHFDPECLSFRIELQEGAWRGMREFSIQSPKTRGFLREWLTHAAARREGLLAPRSDFVRVSVAGRKPLLYFFEEHFDVPLLESQGRREGPIVKFDEDAFWQYMYRYRIASSTLPSSVRDAMLPHMATVSGFSESRLQSDPALAPLLETALDTLTRLSTLMEERWSNRNWPAARSLARDRIGEELGRMLDLDAFAKLDALTSLFRARHGIAWHNRRFYFDPVRSRLEPIVFDTGSGALSLDDPVGLSLDPTRSTPFVEVCRYSSEYRVGVAQAHGRLLDPAWLAKLANDLDEELQLRAALFDSEGGLAPSESPEALWNELELERMRLWNLVHPPQSAACEAKLVVDDSQATLSAILEVQLWGTTAVPVRYSRLVAQNGSISAPIRCRIDGIDVPADTWVDSMRGRVTLEFVVDPRLVNLSSVRELLRRAAEGAASANVGSLDFELVYEVASEKTPRTLALEGRAVRASDIGRPPPPPTIVEFLAQYSFASAEFEQRKIHLAPGVHSIESDLVVPSGYVLENDPAEGAVVLEFASRAALVSYGSLELTGVELRGVAGGTWCGVQVLDAKRPSTLVGVVIRGAGPVERGGWRTTGGVTFYHSDLCATNCRFESAPGEDALNVFGARVTLVDCVFDGAASDAFDGDFVAGSATRCVFRDVVADGIDISGSTFEAVDCEFDRIGDKCLSVGEASHLIAHGLRATNCRIGVASKDASRLEISDSSFSVIGVAALCAFQKKAEYGPATIVAERLKFGDGVAERSLVQSGSTVTLDGVEEPTRAVDVEDLYRGS